MKHFLLSLLFILLVSCTTTDTVQPPCPQPLPPQEAQCPFGQPVLRCTSPCTAPIVVTRNEYTLGYSPDRRAPLWVCETLETVELDGTSQRRSSFPLDPLVPRLYQSPSSVYTRSGYHRGHMAAASNQKGDQIAMDETFFMSNIVPQLPTYNSGIWKMLENWTRGWTLKTEEKLYVISGPIYSKLSSSFLPGTVIPIPTHFWKVLVARRGTKSWHALAFIIPHNDSHKAPYRWQSYQTSVDMVELVTGLDLLPGLSRTDEERIERKPQTYEMWTK